MYIFIDKNRVRLSLLLIVLAGLLLRISAALTDKFLHPWDERFHALVARNLMHHPFVPMLRAYPATENYDKFIWCCNHIWLHKQPLFMWQMALSMKLFGVSEFTMRLPSVLMGTVLILLVFRIAFLLTRNYNVALISAFILALSNFHLQMIGGMKGMDHNDVAHGFYVMASIWAFAEFMQQRKWYWVLLIGLFAGCAILNKWLTGLLVYLGWAFTIMADKKSMENLKSHIWAFFISLLVCVIVFLPWQLYISYRFPDLASYEYEFNRRHITEALEGHEGPAFYYLLHLGDILGNYIFLLFFVGLALWIRDKKKQGAALGYGFMAEILFVFLFFSIIVKTKVDTYLFFVMPLMIIYISIAIVSGLNVLQRYRRPVTVLTLLLCGMVMLKPFAIAKYISRENIERNDRIYNAEIYRNLKNKIPAETKVIMNMNSFEDIDVMFYNNDFTAYHWTLSEADFEVLKRKKVSVAVFQQHGNYGLAPWVLNYPFLYIIPIQLKSN